MSYLRFTWIYAGDGIHISAGLLLVGWILQNETCKGISGRTHSVTAIVNFLRLAYVAGGNAYFKESSIEYLLAINGVVAAVSLATVYLMLVKYKKTVEKDYDTFWIEVLIILSVCLALAYNSNRDDPLDVLFYTSRYLESGAILPQIYFVFRTGSKKLCVSLYVFLSFLYCLFYTYYIAGTDLTRWGDQGVATYNIWPSFIQLAFYVLYFVLLVIVPKYKVEIPLADVESYSESSNSDTIVEGDRTPQPIPTIIVTRPQLDRQQSLLETPFLKKSLPSANSLVNFNPDVKARVKKLHSPLPKRKHKQLDTISLRTVLTLPNMSKTSSFGDLHEDKTMFSIGTPSDETAPQDEGITFTARETAGQSRQRRVAYVRQTSLPEMSTPSPETSLKQIGFSSSDDSDEMLNDNGFLPGDEQIKFGGKKLSHEHAGLEGTNSPGQSAEVATGDEGNARGENENTLGTTQEVNIAGIIETKTYEQKRFFKSKVDYDGKSTDPIRKVSNENRRRQKRISVHKPPMSGQHNWKMIACNFIGTSPSYERRSTLANIHETDVWDSGDEFSSRESLKIRRNSRARVDVHKKSGERHGKVLNDKLKSRRATVHPTVGPSHRHNWKTMASVFIGASPTNEMPSNPDALQRSLSDTTENLTHKQRRKTFWHI